MKKLWQGGALVVLTLILVVGLMTQGSRQAALGQPKGTAGAGPRYTVIETHGFNLLVADNRTNTLYYYSSDKDAPVGSPLKLRASLDLSQVGKEKINIKAINLEKVKDKEKGKEKE